MSEDGPKHLSKEKLKEIESRCAEATPGPWVWDNQVEERHLLYSTAPAPEKGRIIAIIPDVCVGEKDQKPFKTSTPENRNFLGHAREDVPLLAREVRRLREILSGDIEPPPEPKRAAPEPAPQPIAGNSSGEEARLRQVIKEAPLDLILRLHGIQFFNEKGQKSNQEYIKKLRTAVSEWSREVLQGED